MDFDNDIETDKVPPIDFHTVTAAQPGILVAYSLKADKRSHGRYSLKLPVVVGRRGQVSNLQISDHTLSQKHFQIRFEDDQYFIDDFNTTNGTFINGVRLRGSCTLDEGDMIRAGESLLVFTKDIQPFLRTPNNFYRFKGRFYSGVVLEELKEAAEQNRPILLAGRTGTGKELAAGAVAQIKNKSILTYNAASFSSEEEAVTTLVGVESNVFSGVAYRTGLIQQAENGILFLDEIHNYPQRIQRVLLRIVEEGTYRQTGGKEELKSNVSFVFASNADGPTYSLAEDFLGRLRVVSLPDLSQRRADIPELFQFLLSSELKKLKIPTDNATSIFRAEHYEMLCMEDFSADNIRGLIDLSSRIAGYMNRGNAAEWSYFQALRDRQKARGGTNIGNKKDNEYESFDFQESTSVRRMDPFSQAQNSCSMSLQTAMQMEKGLIKGQEQLSRYKEQIWNEYRKEAGNITAVCRALNLMGIEISDKTLKKYIKEWHFPSKKQLKGCS